MGHLAKSFLFIKANESVIVAKMKGRQGKELVALLLPHEEKKKPKRSRDTSETVKEKEKKIDLSCILQPQWL